MFSVVFRTLFIYLFLTIFMRLSGKRQVGQMQVGELVTALLLSELAAFPIADQTVPLIFALLPVAVIVLCEIAVSCLCALFPSMKKLVEGCPSVLIASGKLNQKALYKSRLAPDELLAQLRLKDVSDFSEVDYAILEQNGQLSVILKPDYQPLTPSDMNIKANVTGMAHPLIICGVVDRSNLKRLNLSKDILLSRIAPHRLSDVLIYTVNDGGGATLILRDKSQ